MIIRLDKYLADSGYGTRKTVKDVAKQGRVTVNGETVKKTDIKVDTDKDIINVDGKSLNYKEYEYYILNKPAGVISASEDKSQKTVVDLIKDKQRRDLFPVGRLDKDTEGLLIITNDGIMCNKLLAPGKHVDKVYYALVKGVVTDEDVSLFKEGVDIGDEKLTKPAVLSIIKVHEKVTEDTAFTEDIYEDLLEEECSYSEIKLTITEGRYHQVKRMFEAVGKEVVYLKRLKMGGLILDENLKTGEYRELTKEELDILN